MNCLWLILSLNIVKPSFYSVFAAPEYLCDIKNSVWFKLPWKYQGYHQEMEISGISNSYDYLLQCKVVGCIMWYYCKVIVLVFGKMMGMRAFVWFWVMVSFYGAFSCQIRAQVHLTLLSGFTKTWCLAYYWGCEGLCFGAGERMFRTGRVCFGWLLGGVAAMCF